MQTNTSTSTPRPVLDPCLAAPPWPALRPVAPPPREADPAPVDEDPDPYAGYEVGDDNPAEQPEQAPALPPVAAAERRPLTMLQKIMRKGAALIHEPCGMFVLMQGEAEIARGCGLAELVLHLDVVTSKPPKKPLITMVMPSRMLSAIEQVRDQGETLSNFIRDATQAEIARRQAQDAAELAALEAA